MTGPDSAGRRRWADTIMGHNSSASGNPTGAKGDATASGGKDIDANREPVAEAPSLVATLVSESDTGAVYQGEDRDGAYVTVSLPTAELEALGSPQSVIVTGGDFE